MQSPFYSRILKRKSIRLKGYDYSSEGLYFITICCDQMIPLFGEIENGSMQLNDLGIIAEKCWLEIPEHFPEVYLHEFIIMPNHIHGIIEITVRANQHSPNNDIINNLPIDIELTNQHSPDEMNEITEFPVDIDSPKEIDGMTEIKANIDSPLRSPSKTIGSIIRGYKIGVTKWARQNTDVKNVWQRNYYERIIRDEQSYSQITEYIKNNPAKWEVDKS